MSVKFVAEKSVIHRSEIAVVVRWKRSLSNGAWEFTVEPDFRRTSRLQ